MTLQPCISPIQSMVPGMSLPQDYTALPQPMFSSDMHHSSAHNSPIPASIVVPASPNNASVYDMSSKWDHLFQGGGIFEMTSILGMEAEFGNLTPPDISVALQLFQMLMLARFDCPEYLSVSVSDQCCSISLPNRIYSLCNCDGQNSP